MRARERIKQAATATGSYGYTINTGAAEPGHLTFEQGFQVPSVAIFGSAAYYYDIPVLVSVSKTVWMILLCDMQRDAAGVFTLTSASTRVIASSTFDATTKLFTPLTIAAGTAVTLTVVPLGLSLMDLRGALGLTNSTDGVINSGNPSKLPKRGVGALLALGENAQAGASLVQPSPHSVVIGDDANSYAAQGSYALGQGATVSMPYAGALAGYGTMPQMPFSIGVGCQGINVHGGPTMLVSQKQGGLLMAATTDATATKMQAFDPAAAKVSGNHPALPYSDYFMIDAGVSDFTGVLTCVNPATGTMRRWRLKWTAKTSLDYATTGLIGTLDKSDVVGDAALAACDVNITTVNSGNKCQVEVTGIAATNLVWQLSYDLASHAVWV